MDYWIGGNVSFLSPAGTDSAGMPANVYLHQQPTPGVRLDRWDYDNEPLVRFVYVASEETS